MNFFRKHEQFWKIIVVIASLALIATSFFATFIPQPLTRYNRLNESFA